MENLGSCQLFANVNIYIYFAAIVFLFKYLFVYIHSFGLYIYLGINKIAGLQSREVCHFTSVFETPLSYEVVHRQVDLESQRDPAKRVAWSGKTSLFLPSTLSS